MPPAPPHGELSDEAKAMKEVDAKVNAKRKQLSTFEVEFRKVRNSAGRDGTNQAGEIEYTCSGHPSQKGRECAYTGARECAHSAR
eukprot:3024208-Pyramimonas_sp.AAC.1